MTDFHFHWPRVAGTKGFIIVPGCTASMFSDFHARPGIEIRTSLFPRLVSFCVFRLGEEMETVVKFRLSLFLSVFFSFFFFLFFFFLFFFSAGRTCFILLLLLLFFFFFFFHLKQIFFTFFFFVPPFKTNRCLLLLLLLWWAG